MANKGIGERDLFGTPYTPAHLSDDIRRILGDEALRQHENFHVESGKAKEAFRRAFGARYADHADAADERRSAVEESLKALENWLSSTGSRDDAYVTARAREELRIARELRNLGAAKLRELDALESQANGPDQLLALHAERARQQEKMIFADLTRDVIEHCSRPDAGRRAEEIGLTSTRLSNEARFLLSDVSGGLLGIVSHRQTGKTTEDTRAWLSAMTSRDFDLLRRCFPECAGGFTRLQIASAESAKARAALFAGHSEAETLRPIHRRMQPGGDL